MLYHPSNSGWKVRRHIFVHYAPWHVFKHCVYGVYRAWANSTFAFVFHSLHPDQVFRVHPKYLSQCVTMFQYLLVSYPSWKDVLENAIEECAEYEEFDRQHLKNLQLLMEFFIPAVRLIIIQ